MLLGKILAPGKGSGIHHLIPLLLRMPYIQNPVSHSSYTQVLNSRKVSVRLTGSPLHRENREKNKKESLSGKTQGIWRFWQNTGNSVSSSCKFPDSKGKGYHNICHKNFQYFLKVLKDILIFAAKKYHFFPQNLDRSAKSVLCM